MRNRFRNLHPHEAHGIREVLRWKIFGAKPPSAKEPFVPEVFSGPVPDIGDYVTWIGHSSFLIRLGGIRILVDPVFSDFCAPFAIPRLRRKAAPGIPFEALRDIDLVLITHNHYDHLDRFTIQRLPPDLRYVVPSGLASWFRRLGRTNVLELGWGASTQLPFGQISCVPSQHFSSRTLWDRDLTLWCGWIVGTSARKVYIAGDTGYAPVFQEIGVLHGPLDLSLLPIGAYEPRWFMKPMHVNPEEAVQIHLDVRSRKSVAGHWGTFCLTDEPMDEPPKRLRAALQARNLQDEFVVPRIGETIVF